MKASEASIAMMIFTLVVVIALLPVPLSAQKKNAGTIVYVHRPDDRPPGETTDIYSVEADGTYVKALTKDGRSHSPSWSPDGKRILFIREEGKLYQMDRDGRNLRLLRDFYPHYFPLGVQVKQRRIFSAAWSPDGKSLAVTASSDFDPRGADLFLLPADAQGELKLLVRNAWGPVWSLDGKKIAFSANPAPSRWEVHVVNADGSNEVKLTDHAQYPFAGGAAWSPDGKQIAFSASMLIRLRHDDVRTENQVFLMNADGSGIRQLTTDPDWLCGHPTWSPDGRLIVVSCKERPPARGTREALYFSKLFVISPFDPESKLIQISDHNATSPVFAPMQ